MNKTEDAKKNDKLGAIIALVIVIAAGIGLLILAFNGKKNRSDRPVVAVNTYTENYSLSDQSALSIKEDENAFQIETSPGEVVTIDKDKVLSVTDDKEDTFDFKTKEDIVDEEKPVIITKHGMVFQMDVNASSIQKTASGFQVLTPDGSQIDIPAEEVDYYRVS